jgi:DNA-binding CsgD family transcriptional regulator
MTAQTETDADNTPLLLVDQEGIITGANPAARRLFGSCVGLACATTVRPRNSEGHAVCPSGCPRGKRDLDACWGEVQTRDKVGTLRCSAMGDVVVVRIDGMVEQPTPLRRLTAREREVLALVAQGLPTPAIATRLDIQRSTVRTHMEHCRMKLDAHSQAEAVAKALASHQITLD